MTNPETRGEGETVLLRAALQGLAGQVQPPSMDELWIFPARRNGAVESVVVVASAFVPGDDDRRRILTAHFSVRHEQLKRGTRIRVVRQDVDEQGVAPNDRVGRVVAGVMRRLDDELATLPPRAVQIAGDSDRWAELAAEFGVVTGTACEPSGV